MTPLEVDAVMQAVLDSHLDDHTRRLTAAWVQAWRDVEAELRAAVLGQDVSGYVDPARLRSAIRVIEDRLTTLADEAARTITGSIPDAVSIGADGEAAMVAASYQDRPEKVEVLSSFTRADPEQLDAIIARVTADVALITGTIPADQLDIIRRRLTRGVAVGDNPRLERVSLSLVEAGGSLVG